MPEELGPEEIARLQKEQCIFCHITNGRVPSKKIYEDDNCVAVLDINPLAPGHVLLLPKEHYVILPQIPDELIGHLGFVARGLSQALLRGLQAEGTNVFIANGGVAGQRAQHVLIHVIPRNANDGVDFSLPAGKISDDDRQKVFLGLSQGVKKVLGAVPQQAIASKPAQDNSAKPQAKPSPDTPKPSPDAKKSLDDITKFLAK